MKINIEVTKLDGGLLAAKLCDVTNQQGDSPVGVVGHVVYADDVETLMLMAAPIIAARYK